MLYSEKGTFIFLVMTVRICCQQQQPAQSQQHESGDKDKKRKETILDLSKYLDKPIRVKFAGGREGKCS